MASKMVDRLNGSMEWLFKRSTICLFGDKIKGNPLMGSVTVMKRFCPTNHLSNGAIKEGTHH
jgi:hypothetical protein